MSNKDTMQRFYDEVNAGNLGVVDEVLVDDFVEHDEFPGLEQTKAGVKQFFEMSRAAFPDMHIRLLHLAEDGDVAIAHAMFEGTQEGEFLGVPPSGKHVSVPMADVVRFDADGRAVEHWGVTDTGAMMMQLGAVAAPAG